MEVNEREWEQLWAQLRLLEARHSDFGSRVVRLEEQVHQFNRDHAELRSAVKELTQTVTSLTEALNKVRGGWKTLIVLGTALGVVLGAVVTFFSRGR